MTILLYFFYSSFLCRDPFSLSILLYSTIANYNDFTIILLVTLILLGITFQFQTAINFISCFKVILKRKMPFSEQIIISNIQRISIYLIIMSKHTTENNVLQKDKMPLHL